MEKSPLQRSSDGAFAQRFLLAGGIAAALIIAVVTAVAACGSGIETAPAKVPAAKRGGTLTVAFAADPDALNPYLARGMESLYLANRTLPRLFREVLPDETHQAGLEPEWAESFTFQDGGRTLLIKLRPGRWSNGQKLTCADIQFTHQAVIDPQVAWRAAQIKKQIAKVECPDPQTVRIRFNKALPTGLMDVNDTHILPRSLAEIPFSNWRRTDWQKAMTFGGPFRPEKITPQQELVLVPNPGWYGGPDQPYLERVVLRIVPDALSRMNQLLAGDLDIADNLTPGNVQRLMGDANLKVIRRPGWSYTYLGFNFIEPAAYAQFRKDNQAACQAKKQADCPEAPSAVVEAARNHPHPLFGDLKVRRAIVLALDRQALIDTLLRGEGEIPPSPILAPLAEHDPALTPWPVDLARAQAELKAAGWADSNGDGTLDRQGKPLVFTMAVQAGNQLRREAAVMIQRDLAQVGIGVQIEPVENSAFVPSVLTRKYDAWLGGWQASLRVDLAEAFSAEGCGTGGVNFGLFVDPEMDAILAKARDLVDSQARVAEFRRWERKFHETLPYAILFRPRRLIGIRTRIHGAESILANDPLNQIERWWVDQAAPAR